MLMNSSLRNVLGEPPVEVRGHYVCSACKRSVPFGGDAQHNGMCGEPLCGGRFKCCDTPELEDAWLRKRALELRAELDVALGDHTPVPQSMPRGNVVPPVLSKGLSESVQDGCASVTERQLRKELQESLDMLS